MRLTKSKLIQIIPFLFSLSIAITGLIINEFYFQIDEFGKILVVCLIPIVIWTKNIWKYLFTTLLILDILGLLELSNFSFSISFGGLTIDTIPVAVLLTLIAFNPDIVGKERYAKKTFNGKHRTYVKPNNDSQIEYFYSKFSNKSKEELHEMKATGGLSKEALIAVNKLILETK